METRYPRIDHIMNCDNERELLAMAYTVEGCMRVGGITPKLYAEAMVLLSQKLGFGITAESLSEASAKYIDD